MRPVPEHEPKPTTVSEREPESEHHQKPAAVSKLKPESEPEPESIGTERTTCQRSENVVHLKNHITCNVFLSKCVSTRNNANYKRNVSQF